MKQPHQLKIQGSDREVFDIEKMKAIRIKGNFESLKDVIKTKEQAEILIRQMEWLDKHPNETEGWRALNP